MTVQIEQTQTVTGNLKREDKTQSDHTNLSTLWSLPPEGSTELTVRGHGRVPLYKEGKKETSTEERKRKKKTLL